MSKTKVYVAGSSAECGRARAVAKLLEEQGFEVVSTWWDDVEKEGVQNPTDEDLRRAYSAQDLDQVRSSEVLLLLIPREGAHSHGAFLEFGYALSHGLSCVASGDTKRSIFCSLALECETDEEAVAMMAFAEKMVDDQLKDQFG